jgi:hypothetical protein
MVFIQRNAAVVEWGPAGTLDAAGLETVWFADSLPSGSEPILAAGMNALGWVETAAGAAADALEADHGVLRDEAGHATVAATAALRGRWPQPYLELDFRVLDRSGLDAFVETLERRIARTDDRLDMGFLRARADIYRLRQFSLGADAAARLVTSPTVAEIAVREPSARATAEALDSFLQSSFAAAATREPSNPLIRTPFRPGAPSGAPEAAEGFTTLGLRASPRIGTTLAFDLTASTAKIAGATTDAGRLSLEGFRAGELVKGPVAIDIQDARPLPGKVDRTASVADRLPEAPAVEAHQFALEGKLEALASVLRLTGGDEREGVALADLAAPGWRRPDSDEAPTIGDLAGDRSGFEDENSRPTNDDRHEAAYFSAAAATLDNTFALMRQIEGRVSIYRALLDDARRTREEVRGTIAAADTRLRAIDLEVAEARHDAGVAAALLAEERERVAAINRRRRAIIDRYVDHYIFRRPRRTPLVRATPTASVVPAPTRTGDAIAPPDDGSAPEALADYVALLRETPAAWWPAARAAVAALDRLATARAALAAVHARAALPPPPPPPPPAASPIGRAIAGALATGIARASSHKAEALALDLGAVARLDLSGLRQGLLAHATLADLVAGEQLRQAAANRIAEEVARIGDAAAWLHRQFCEVAPAIRLGWAETLSAFDAPAPLADLSALTGWGGVPLALRRELQRVVDWLFTRIDRGQPGAERAIDELVRIALLLAAQAPVDRLIPARLVAPVPVRPGAMLELSVDVLQVRVGMIARLASTAGLVEARVVDLGDGAARAEVIRSTGAVGTLASGMRFELAEAAVLR